MTIHSFAFEDRETGWRLEETSFGDVNLLVGVTGVGKTRILGALLDVGRTALGKGVHLGCSTWALRLGTPDGKYLWTAEIDVSGASGKPAESRFVRERIVREDDEVLVERSERFEFEGRKLPRLQESRSAVELLQSEPSIHPLYEEFNRWQFFGLPQERFGVEPLDLHLDNGARVRLSLDELRQATDLPFVAKAFFLQEGHAEVFASVREAYADIFPTVLDLRVASYADFKVKSPFQDEDRWFTLGIREKSVDGWVVRRSMSAGMWKVLTFVIELTLSQTGSVFLVDEIENSLGVNCLPDLAKLLLEKSGEVQMVMTSHHPQVINTITPEHWRLVTRRGPVVTVRPASDGEEVRRDEAHSQLREISNPLQIFGGGDLGMTQP